MGRISTLIVIVLSAALLWSCSKSGKAPSHEAACKHIIPIICDSAPTPAEKTQCKTEFTEKLAEFTADCAQEIKSKNISPSCIMKAKTMADLEGCEAQAKTKGKKGSGGSAKAKTAEAIDNLDKLYKGAVIYFTSPRVNREGGLIPCQFPDGGAAGGLTPAPGPDGKHPCCGIADADGDGRCDSNPNVWADHAWPVLSFQMTDQHYYAYAVESSGTLGDAKITISAYGDLDCDGVWSTFQKIGFADEGSSRVECSVKGSSAFYVDEELE
ncbi:MAG: hypothetical protein CMH54_09905 [Myxococcales bacterium]|nr:hypothetical protein [Myxococcales bacterium]|tara:strand:+ start:1491 stop:2297 length:807 start_codon:yes stop_codon:yes gene_type:complete